MLALFEKGIKGQLPLWGTFWLCFFPISIFGLLLVLNLKLIAFNIPEDYRHRISTAFVGIFWACSALSGVLVWVCAKNVSHRIYGFVARTIVIIVWSLPYIPVILFLILILIVVTGSFES